MRISRQVCVTADLDQPPADTADAYLRLHLLSHRLVRPNSMNLDGIFKILPNVGWTSLGPVAAGDQQMPNLVLWIEQHDADGVEQIGLPQTVHHGAQQLRQAVGPQ